MKIIKQVLLIASIAVVPAFSTLMANEVVVYTSVDDVFARPIAEKFEQQTGITVKLVTDTEEIGIGSYSSSPLPQHRTYGSVYGA